MIKVLWVCNVPNKQACDFLGINGINVGGWLTGLSKGFEQDSDVKLVYCFPGTKKQQSFKTKGVSYYSFYEPRRFGLETNKHSKIQDKQIRKIIELEKPDIIHMFGTEYLHSYVFLKNAKNIKVCCSIQGLLSPYSKHFLDLVPSNIYKKINLSCLVKGTLFQQKKNMEKRAVFEQKTIKECKYIIGRTEWDKRESFYLNPNRIYYKCNESLRDQFYKYEWRFTNCVKHRIFFSQASSPLKGFNVLIEALNILKDKYPDISVHVAGNNLLKKNGLINRLKYSTYASYIDTLLSKYGLKKSIHFCGNLSEESMVNEYMCTNVYVSSSAMENSSNSVSEAMILGVPVISSDVGGISSLVDDNTNGFLYNANSPLELSHCIEKVFGDDAIAVSLGLAARKKALITHDRSKNTNSLKEAYFNILND